MPRLIEIENAIRIIDRYISDDDTNLNIKLAITNIPTVDAEPVRHGHWGEVWFDHKPKIVCSVCECFADKWTDYCPNCGAKMQE